MLGHFLNFAGRPEEAITLVKKAMRLNPRYPFLYSYYLGHAYLLLRRYEEALAAYKDVVTHGPDFLWVHHDLVVIYSELGYEEKAQAEAAEVLRINPQYTLEWARKRISDTDPAVRERILTALRKAGLK